MGWRRLCSKARQHGTGQQPPQAFPSLRWLQLTCLGLLGTPCACRPELAPPQRPLPGRRCTALLRPLNRQKDAEGREQQSQRPGRSRRAGELEAAAAAPRAAAASRGTPQPLPVPSLLQPPTDSPMLTHKLERWLETAAVVLITLAQCTVWAATATRLSRTQHAHQAALCAISASAVLVAALLPQMVWLRYRCGALRRSAARCCVQGWLGAETRDT